MNSFLPGSRFYSPMISADPHGAVQATCCLSDEGPSYQRTKGPKFPPSKRVSPSSCSCLRQMPPLLLASFISVLGDRQGQCSCCHVPINHFISCSGSSHSEVLTLPGREPLGITLSHSGTESSDLSVPFDFSLWEHFTVY